MTWITLLGGVTLIAATGAMLGAGLGLTGIILLYFQAGGATQLAATAVWNVFTDFTLSAIPLFIILGEVLLASGVSSRIYHSLTPLFSRIPGQLLHTNIAVCTLFGAVSGSSTSTAAAVGSVGYPELAKRGYNRAAVVGSLAAGGTLGLLIPPSIGLLIYGATQNVSIGKLFMAGVVPGIMIAGLFSILIIFMSLRRKDLTPEPAERVTLREIADALLGIWPVPLLIFFMLGSIYFGFATVTEAAAVGIVGAIALGFTWGDLTLRKLWGAFMGGTLGFAPLAMVLIGTLILAQAISIIGVPRDLIDSVAEMNLSAYTVLLAICLVYLILGMFFDGISLLLMTLPIVFPLIVSAGFDPVWFGVIVIILVEVGMITPPVGMNLFVLVTIAGREVTLIEAARATIPYWIVMIAAIGLLVSFPQIALFLPTLM